MEKKTPGKLNSPPTQENFDKLPLEDFCRPLGGIFYRLHSFNAKNWQALVGNSFQLQGQRTGLIPSTV
jgi:hypothetical protein